MITPIMANGVVAQTQNVNIINNAEDTKTQVAYQNSQVATEQQSEEAHRTVISSQDSNKTDTRHDASEEGKNKYFASKNDGKKKKTQEFGQVVKKQNMGGFNITV
ncbi:MAG: hypothetical protein Q4D29_07340 [Lachnospiraceae bacterium]|nr:hypothetical protein [Lachnospiraceae bacterium]